jgi:hypothetical protein
MCDRKAVRWWQCRIEKLNWIFNFVFIFCYYNFKLHSHMRTTHKSHINFQNPITDTRTPCRYNLSLPPNCALLDDNRSKEPTYTLETPIFFMFLRQQFRIAYLFWDLSPRVCSNGLYISNVAENCFLLHTHTHNPTKKLISAHQHKEKRIESKKQTTE